MIRRIAIAAVALAFLGLLVFSLLSWRAAIAPIERPNPASFSAESIAKGEILAAEGHCALLPHPVRAVNHSRAGMG